MQDQDLMLCKALSIAGTATTETVFTDQIYIPQIRNFKNVLVNDSPFNSGRMFWNCVVEDEDLLAGTDGSVITFKLYNDTDATPTTGGDVIVTFAITENTPSEHKDGTLLFSIPLPAGPLKPYFGASATIATQTLSTGKVTSWIGTPHTQATSRANS